MQAALAQFTTQGVTSQSLVVSHAFHSTLMDPMLAEFERVASTITYARPQRKLISNVTGGVATAELVSNAAYWRRHVREPVQFTAAMQTLAEQGITTFIEIGPHPVLTGMWLR